MNDNMIVARAEIFDPVLGVSLISGLEAGIDWINRADFADTASLLTECGSEARRSHDRVDSGTLAVNAGSAAPVPFFHFGGLNDAFLWTSALRATTRSGSTSMRQCTPSDDRTRWTDGSCPVAFGLPGGRRRQLTARSGTPSARTGAPTARDIMKDVGSQQIRYSVGHR